MRFTRNESLSDFVEAAIGPAARRRGLAATTLIADWPLVVGERLAVRCQPVKLAFAPGRQAGGTLHLHAAASAALDLQFSERQVVERVNAHYGFAAVARLKIIQSPPVRPIVRPRRPPRSLPSSEQVAKLKTDTDRIDDPQLAEALLRLGCSIAAVNGPGR